MKQYKDGDQKESLDEKDMLSKYIYWYILCISRLLINLYTALFREKYFIFVYRTQEMFAS